MPRFTVDVVEVWENRIEVEAETEEQAREFVRSGYDSTDLENCAITETVEFNCVERTVNNIYREWVSTESRTVYNDVFDNLSLKDLFGEQVEGLTIETLADRLEEDAYSYISNNTANMIVGDWAGQYLEKVDWKEIAEHMIQEEKERR